MSYVLTFWKCKIFMGKLQSMVWTPNMAWISNLIRTSNIWENLTIKWWHFLDFCTLLPNVFSYIQYREDNPKPFLVYLKECVRNGNVLPTIEIIKITLWLWFTSNSVVNKIAGIYSHVSVYYCFIKICCDNDIICEHLMLGDAVPE